MKPIQKIIKLHRVIFILILIVLSACSQNPSTIPAMEVETPSSVPPAVNTPLPANTNTPLPAATDTPEPTQIPGSQVFPITSLASNIPWLSLEKGKEPMTVY